MYLPYYKLQNATSPVQTTSQEYELLTIICVTIHNDYDVDDDDKLFFAQRFTDGRPLRDKCSYSEFFWSVFSHTRTEYGDLKSKSPYSVQMWENADQKNSEYGQFLRSWR